MQNFQLVKSRTFYQKSKDSADHSAQWTVYCFHDEVAGDAYWRLFNATKTYDQIFHGSDADSKLTSLTFNLQYGK